MTEYSLRDLLREQERAQEGYDALQTAIGQCELMMGHDDQEDVAIILRIHHRVLLRALALFRDVKPEQTLSH